MNQHASQEIPSRVDALGDQAERHVRRWFRKIWDARGGGLYSVVFALTFLYLETRELLFDDIPTLLGLESYDVGSLIGLVVNVLFDLIMNTIAAALWPLWVLQWWPPIGAIGLLVAFLAFPVYLKPKIERWLFRD